ncbi:MAG: carbohydrate ABC transporter permease [Candidatus Bipolaricaulia bacterium]
MEKITETQTEGDGVAHTQAQVQAQALRPRTTVTFDQDSLLKEKRKERALRTSIYTFLIVAALPIFLGYAWIFIASFSKGLTWGIIPNGLTIENWRFLWKPPTQAMPIVWPVFWNTMYLGLGTALVTVLLSTPTGYAISRLKVPGRKLFLGLTLILHAFPGISLLIALFWVLQRLHMLNSVTGVILVNAGLMAPFAIWVMKGFFDGIPWDVEMSALVDGATRFQTWYRVMLPQVRPGIFAISIFAFIAGWSTFIYVLVFILKKQGWTLSSYVFAVLGNFRFVDFGLLAATAVFYVIPVLLFFLFTNKYLMKVTVGGMKGGG